MRKTMMIALPAALLTLAAGLVLIRFERPVRAQGITLDRSLLAMLPAQATSLVGVDLEKLKATAVYRRIEEQHRPGQSQLDEFAAKVGFDPRRDVSELLVAAWGRGEGAQKPHFVAVARGSFNVAALSAELRAHQAVVEQHRGFDVYGPPKPASSGEEEGRFVFLDAKTVLAGTRAAVLGALDRKVSGGPSLQDKAALLSRVQSIRGSGQVWAVSETPGEIVSGALPRDPSAQGSNFARIFASMQNSTFAADLMNGLDLKAAGVCKTAQDAKTLGEALRGLLAMGRLAINPQEPEMLALLDGVRVEERDTQLDVFVQVDMKTLEKILEKPPGRGRVRAAKF